MKVRRRSRDSWKKPWLTVLTLAVTVPTLALFCRGYSPNRYAVANLPPWERIPPAAKAPLGPLAVTPVVTNFTLNRLSVYHGLAGADENEMFHQLESVPTSTYGIPNGPGYVDRRPPRTIRFEENHPHSVYLSNDPAGPVDKWRTDAGKPGVWLEESSVLADQSPCLRAKADRIVVRMMNDQTVDGYLGAPSSDREYTAADVTAQANNLRGLLAYYACSRQPAALFSAMRAGDFVVENYAPFPGQQDPATQDDVVCALTRLYLECGDPKYLEFAIREAAARGCDELGFCELFRATGTVKDLAQAEVAWNLNERNNRSRSSSHLESSAELFKLTGDMQYLHGLQAARLDSIWPISVAYTRSARGLSINVLYPAILRIGAQRIRIDIPDHSTATNLDIERAAASRTSAGGSAAHKSAADRGILLTQELGATVCPTSAGRTTHDATSSVIRENDYRSILFADQSANPAAILSYSVEGARAAVIHVTFEPGAVAESPLPVLVAFNGKNVSLGSGWAGVTLRTSAPHSLSAGMLVRPTTNTVKVAGNNSLGMSGLLASHELDPTSVRATP